MAALAYRHSDVDQPMRILLGLCLACAFLSALSRIAAAADTPSELIVGSWRDRNEPNDAVISFSKDGTGTIAEASGERPAQAKLAWKVTGSYGNACVVVIKYVMPESKRAGQAPPGEKPMTWLVVFDGKDSFLVQPRPNDIVFMDRQKTPQANERKGSPQLGASP
jgi:hypothetical protein